MSKHLFLLVFTVLVGSLICKAQDAITINAKLDTEDNKIQIQQDVVFYNRSQDTLNFIYLNDWAHSFSSKKSPLAQRFAENYERRFHRSDESERGYTKINNVTDSNNRVLSFNRLDNQIDVIKLQLKNPIYPGKTFNFKLFYEVQLPESRFTQYGYLENGNYNLRYWYISPAVYDGVWHHYSNKNLNDLFLAPTDFDITFSLPKAYKVISELDISSLNSSYVSGHNLVRLSGDNRDAAVLFLRKQTDFEFVETDSLKVLTNIYDAKVSPPNRALLVEKIISFLDGELGSYPFEQLILSTYDYNENPVYGLNQLPDFISPFPDGFQYELKILKTALNNYIDKVMFFDSRNDRWATDGMKTYLMMRYMDRYYPDLKVLGNLERYWLVRQFNISQVEFNDQFNLLYLHMARLNLDQPLTAPYDSLIKFNKNIANAYKAGSGLNYLAEYTDDFTINLALQDFYKDQRLKLTTTKEFEKYLRGYTQKNLDWFFKDYINSRKKVDYKFNEIRKKGDSLHITIRNKRTSKMPIPLYGLKKDSIIFKTWLEGFEGEKIIHIPSTDIDRLALNLEGIVPEYDRRDNYKKINSFIFNKPFQFKLLQDIEDPSKNQVFFMPIAEYNFYDGLQLGLRMYNKTILTKAFDYKIAPRFGLKSDALVGSLGLSYTQNIEEGNLYAVRYGFSGATSSYAPDAFYRRYSPYLTFAFRTDDLRSDKRQFLTIRSVNVSRDNSEVITNDEPNYSVFNVSYSNSSPGIIHRFSWNTDFELAKKFSKISFSAKYRKIFLSNRQFDLRFFAGAFLYNDARQDGDYFSFALDRPTDYLFEYNYYGRSESSGLFSQQFIMAEGGFKSVLDTPFANEWITTLNTGTTLWNFIHMYGDVGLVKNHGRPAQFVYDSGIRTVLVEDYFELFFPVYSNNGWEIAQPDYDQKIRFIVTLDLRTFLNLFTRRWY